jgi:hypothetical protein
MFWDKCGNLFIAKAAKIAKGGIFELGKKNAKSKIFHPCGALPAFLGGFFPGEFL